MPESIPEQESLTVEFKSDRGRLPDADLAAAVICLANSEGGELYVGIEADGKVTGLHPAHQNVAGLAAMIANRTVPPLSVRVEAIDTSNGRVAKVTVPKSRQLVATSEGVLQRRRAKADGSPECVPFYPHEFAQRRSDLGLLDYSALPVADAVVEDFDPVERARLRQVIERYGGDTSLLPLRDEEPDGALGLIHRDEGSLVPTVTGLLLLGKEAALRRYLPTHEVAFQILEGTSVRVNDFYRSPLLRVFERVMDHFSTRRIEEDVQVGLFRVGVPIQRDEGAARAVLERLVEAVLVEAHGVKRGRTFTLAASVYREIGDRAGYVGQAGFDRIQQEQMILKYARENGRITRREAASLCHLSDDQASRILRKLSSENKLRLEGERRGAYYRLP